VADEPNLSSETIEELRPREGDQIREANKATKALRGCGVPTIVAVVVALVAAGTVLAILAGGDDDEESTATSESTSSSSSSSAVAAAPPEPVAPAAAPGSGPCAQYHVTGTWTIDQGGGYTPTVSLRQTGTNLTGEFVLSDAEAQGANVVSPSNPVTGSLTGDQLVFVASQAKKDGSKSEGEYKGTVTEAGIANGTARDKAVSGGGSVPWTMTGGTFTCVKRA
jgi:hypothetical protein